VAVRLRLTRVGKKKQPTYRIVAADARSPRDGKYLDASGQSFRDFLEGRLPVLEGELPTVNDWADHVTTAFPEVRLKRYLEII